MPDNPITSWLYPVILKLSKKHPAPSPNKFSLKSTRNVLLLFHLESNSYRNTIHDFVKEFESMGIRVSTIEYIDQSNPDSFELKERHHFNLAKKDLNFWGLPRKSFRQKAFEAPLDLVINFSLNNILPFHFLVGVSGASLKIGFLENDFINAYDFIINNMGNNNLKEHKDAIFDYLNRINKS